jgi:large subunit ribosomal protein L25
MEKVVLHALPRTIKGKQVSVMRRQGQLPAVIYGHNFDATPISLDLKDATKKLIGLTPTTLVYIDLEGKEHAALVREKQRNYIRNTIIHVDFQAVSLKEKIRAGIIIELTGLSPAVKDFNAIVMNGTSVVHVEGLPQDLPEHLVVDLSVLKNIGDVIRVKDLVISDKITVMTDLEEMVALITMPQQEVEEEVVEEVVAEGEPEVIEKGKKEEEEEAK